MKELKVGDLVNCYFVRANPFVSSQATADKIKGTVHKIMFLTSIVTVRVDSEHCLINPKDRLRDFHIKQIRKIKSKPRRVIWVNEYSNFQSVVFYDSKEEAEEDTGSERIRTLKFREVREK